MTSRKHALTIAIALLAIVVATLPLVLQHEPQLVAPESAGGIEVSPATEAAEPATASRGAPSRVSVVRSSTAGPSPAETASTSTRAKQPTKAPNPRLPLSPNLHVHVRDPEGRLTSGGQATAALRGSRLVQSRSELHNGEGHLTVEVGHEAFVVELRLRDYTLASCQVAGPQRLGHEVDVELVVPANLPVLVVRERRAPDRSGPKAFLELEPRVAATTQQGRAVPTFARPLRAEIGESEEYRFPLPLECLEVRFDGFLLKRNDLRGVLVGPFEIRAGRNDLGPVVLHEPVELVSGRVFDERNQPYTGVKFEIPEANGILPSVFVSRVDRSKRSLFAIHGVFVGKPGTPLHLEVSGDWVCGVEPIAFAVGTKDLAVTVVPAGHLVAEFLLPTDLPAEKLGAVLRPRGTKRIVPGSQWKTDAFVYGEVRWFGLASGEYDLLVHPPGRKDPLEVLLGLKVRAGERCPDTRLSGIDLTRLR